MLRALAIALVVAAAAPAHADGDVEFYDTLNADRVQLGDTVTLTIQLSGGNEAGQADIQMPVTPDFEVLGQRRSSSTRMEFLNGNANVVRSQILRVTLQPKRTGTLHIAPCTATIGGRTYRTGDLTLRVDAADPNAPRHRQAQPQQQIDPFAQFFGGQNPFAGMPGMGDDDADPFNQMFGQQGPPRDSDLFLRTSVDRKQAYLGEQITFSIYLFARVDVSRVDNPKLPKLDAFWAEDVDSPTNITGEVRNVNGVPYRVYLLKRRALFPVKAGPQTIDPVEVDVVTGLSLFGNGRTVHRTSQAVTVNVLPLPAGAPPGFAPTDVGQWRLHLTTNPSSGDTIQTTLGQPVTLDLTLEGFGNLRNVTAPELEPVRGLRYYDPTTTDKVQVVRNRFGGKRTYEYIVMPEQTGHFTIPAASFSYFNPTTQKYELASTKPLTIEVTPGAAAANSTGGLATAAAGQNVLNANLARPIHTRAALSDAAAPLWVKPYFLPVLLFPFGLMLGGAAFGGLKNRAGREDPNKRIRTAQSRARKRFKGAEALLEKGDANAYYGAVAKAMNDYLTDKLGFAAAGLTLDELGRRLASSGAKPENVVAVKSVLESCDHGRFAPGSAEGRREVLEHAASAVEALEDLKLRRTPPEARA